MIKDTFWGTQRFAPGTREVGFETAVYLRD
jgi:hypothetical protein